MHMFWMLQIVWACNLCRKKQELLVKTGQWYHGGMARPVALDVDTGSETSSIKTDISPTHEKKRFPNERQQGAHSDGGQSSEKENIAQHPSQKQDSRLGRTGSLHGKELRRQYSLADGISNRGERTADTEPSGSSGNTPGGGKSLKDNTTGANEGRPHRDTNRRDPDRVITPLEQNGQTRSGHPDGHHPRYADDGHSTQRHEDSGKKDNQEPRGRDRYPSRETSPHSNGSHWNTEQPAREWAGRGEEVIHR